ncbi:GNAT family N-acetyltransferase [Listeria grandensis]|uniref:GNAT family N-acetyltransferase n=1 Tax=Listeria grandensis TaxID=1494963 RepID=A0A7X1CPQ6_9LIST|nr:GNAT family protein [Listeria grandensis]MBC1936217.1 GNAT family N-acetyltransferase [Listeria grandensis]MBC6315225.1 GNAT family N-acetyltransferase [Listeria grandensis]
MRQDKLLQGEFIFLRPLHPNDLDAYYTMFFNEDVRRLTGTKQAFTYPQIEQYIATKWQESDAILLLICLQDTEEVIGDIAIQDIDTTNRHANLRIAISKTEHQSKGYGSEAMRLMLDYGFGILNLHRIELNVFDYNKQATRAYEKVGFIVEGIQREALFYNHTYHDSITMSILAREYRKKYQK